LQQRSSGVVLCETHVIIDQDGVPVEHTDTYYAAERYVFDAVVERAPEAGRSGGSPAGGPTDAAFAASH
jgi:hypothetical protein